MPRKSVPDHDLVEIKREAEEVLGQSMQLVSGLLKQVGELKRKLEGLEVGKR